MLIDLFESPSVTISADGTVWPMLDAHIDAFCVADEFPELRMTPDEVMRIVESVFERVNEELYEYMPDYLSEVRS